MKTLLLAWSLFAGQGEIAEMDDPFLWLEGVEDARALDWVRERNKESLAVLENDSRFPHFLKIAERLLQDKERIPYGSLYGPWVYNFWQDEKHIRGIWRRTTRESYRRAEPDWEIILDVDKLSEMENENWVFQGTIPLTHDDFDRVMINLSRGGSDASVWREFDVKTKSFVAGGFDLPQAKSRIAWYDRDHLLVGTDFGSGSLTSSGYPRIIKLWKRSTPLQDAKTLFEGKETDVSVSSIVSDEPNGRVRLIGRGVTFFTTEYFLLDDQSQVRRIAMPESAELAEISDGYLYFQLREPMEAKPGTTISRGSLVRYPLSKIDVGPTAVETVLSPSERQSIQGVEASRSFLNISLLDNVAGSVLRLKRAGDSWESEQVELPANGATGIISSNAYTDDLFVTFTGFLDPPSLYEVFEKDPLKPVLIKQLPPKFDASSQVVERHDATSKDGTRIPYFVVRPKNAPMNGTTPTLLYAYGGFEIPMLPAYSGIIGKLWLEEGGAYVLACIRGGGEFGPAWHQAALKENRQRAYDDFAAVAEDLIKSKLTSPPHLGISGASNGGLLVGTAFTQRPELFGAVVCGVPLLDMIRYTKLLAGASWIGEYGDPEDPEMKKSILAYSPYQNVAKTGKYPEVFFVTSTKDDRVHPGHARKMVAKMLSQGHQVYYFENIEGGHSAAANLLQRARRIALEFTYLHLKLFPKSH